MVKQEISSVKNWKEAVWETTLWCFNSSLRVTAFPSRRVLLRLFLWNWISDTWKPIEGYGEKGIFSIKNWKEAFWETALCSLNSSHRFTAFPSRSRSLRLFLWSLQSDIWKPLEGFLKNEISSDKNCKESFWKTALSCANSSQRITAFPSRILSLRLFLWNLQSDIWKPKEGYGEKGNIFR